MITPKDIEKKRAELRDWDVRRAERQRQRDGDWLILLVAKNARVEAVLYAASHGLLAELSTWRLLRWKKAISRDKKIAFIERRKIVRKIWKELRRRK